MCRRSLETNYTDFVCKTLQLIQDFVNIIILCRIKNNLSNSYWRRITGTQISDCGMQRGERFGHEVRARGWINRCGSSWGGDCWGLKTVHVFPLVGLLQSSNSSPESGDFFRKNIVSLWRKKKVTRRFFYELSRSTSKTHHDFRSWGGGHDGIPITIVGSSKIVISWCLLSLPARQSRISICYVI